MYAWIPMVLASLAVSSTAVADPMRAEQWLSLDVAHVSRSLPFDDPIGHALNPSVLAGYHRNVFGDGALGAGFSFRVGALGYDELLWSLSAGTGIEGTLRLRWGLFAALGLRLDYARAFTGSNNFEVEGGSYRQMTDTGRSFVRITPLDVAIGFSPADLQRWGVIPLLRFSWLLDAPIYDSAGANPWSYLVMGIGVLWTWEGER
jgi:hypothetical protein